MSIPFGAQLIGQIEKTLGVVLRRLLEGTGLTEPQWVTLRLADQMDGESGFEGLVDTVADRAHYADAAELVAELADRGLLGTGRLTPAGRALVDTTQARIADETATLWHGLADDDVTAAARVLNEVLTRARRLALDRA